MTLRINQLIFIFVLISLSLLSACAGPAYKAKQNDNIDIKLIDGFSSNSITFGKHKLSYHTTELSSAASNSNNNKLPIIFVHGTPGSWKSFKYVMSHKQLHNNFAMASVNRLGWNKAEDDSKQEKTSDVEIIKLANFELQAEAIAEIIKSFSPNKPVILVGHSLGASITPSVALNYPELVSGLLLISGTIDPKLGKPRWYNRLSQMSLINKALPARMALANKEISELEQNLIAQSAVWDQLSIPVTVIQGMKDKLVSPQNSEFAKSKLTRLGEDFALHELEDAGHFIIWEEIPVVAEALLELKKKLQ